MINSNSILAATDDETALEMHMNCADWSVELRQRLKKAFDHTTLEGQKIIVTVAEALSNYPDFHVEYSEESGAIPPPDSVWHSQS